MQHFEQFEAPQRNAIWRADASTVDDDQPCQLTVKLLSWLHATLLDQILELCCFSARKQLS